ncbi:MAG: sulfatase-like hydrolase/transferase [Verrucomicrobiota bacterium]
MKPNPLLPFFASVLFLLPFQGQAAGKPNVLLILADDLGYGEIAAQGYTKDIPTPHIDSIAKNGVRFSSGYVSGPYCSPTRAGLLTGRYQQRFGHEFNPGPSPVESFGLDVKQKTLGDHFKNLGYATGWFGKSHLGNKPEFHPNQRGFDEFYGFLGGAHTYLNAATADPIQHNGTPADKIEYATESFAAEAVKFIGANKGKPWLAYVPFNAVHGPLETLEKYESRFSSITDEKRRKFAGLLSALDDAVGTLLAKVRENGEEENTLIIFHSDNGGPTRQTSSGNGPLKGFKATTWEGGVRVPFFVQWKGKIPAGKVDDRPVIQLDLLPTALAAAGAEVPADAEFDGVNLLPYLTGEKAEAPHEALFWRFGGQIAVRKGDWKLVKGATDEKPLGQLGFTSSLEGAQLYNLSSDIGEQNDLAAKEPEKVKELAAAWETWNSQNVEAKWLPGNRQGQGKGKKTQPQN